MTLTGLFIWLVLGAGKINEILRCDWLPERGILPTPDYPLCPARKKFPESHVIKSFIDQACSVKMAGYWTRSIFVHLISS